MISDKKIKISYIDFTLLIILMLFLVISVLFIYSGTKNIESLKSRFLNQIIYGSIGLICGIFLLTIDLKKINDISEFIYLAGIFLLLLTLFIGKEVRSSKSWIRFGSIGIQPSEFMKLFYILFLAKIISLYQNDDKYRKSIRFFFICLLVTIIPVLLILKQPDFGSAFIFLLIFITIGYFSDLNTELLILLIIMGLFIFSLPLLRIYIKL
ncbi:MAG: FtsW/RodA/SpoVE family cell cycle protein, partial [Exilispira sp.]